MILKAFRRKLVKENKYILSVMKKLFGILTHPVGIFILFQFMWVSLTVLWVLWYVDRMDALTELRRIGFQAIDLTNPTSALVWGLILLVVMLIGSIWLFIFGQKRASDFKQQQFFVSSVTHELRSPLASLLLTFETLKKREPPENIKQQMFENGQKDCERLLRLVNQILISSRLDRGIESFDETIETLDLEDLIKQACDRAELVETGSLNRIEINCPDGLNIEVPESAFLLLMSNLVENAVKYSPDGGKIKIRVLKDGNDYVKISISDPGFGLDKTELKKIFRMFHRGTIANTKAIKGTGIGLFIVKTVSKILGGHVWAESEGRSKGSTFHLRLPLNGRFKRK
jgi:signal transduction histidine kinase